MSPFAVFDIIVLIVGFNFCVVHVRLFPHVCCAFALLGALLGRQFAPLFPAFLALAVVVFVVDAWALRRPRQ